MADKEKLKVYTSFLGEDKLSPVLKKIHAETRVTFSGLASAAKSVTKLIGGIGITGAVAGVASAVYAAKEAFDSLSEQASKLDELGDAAERLGVGVEFLNEWQYAAKIAGASSESVASAIQKVNKQLGQAQVKSGKLFNYLKKAALPEEQKRAILGAATTEDAFVAVMEAINSASVEANKSGLAIAAFGDEGAALIPLASKGKQEWQVLFETVRKLNPVTEQMTANAGAYSDAVDNLKTSWEGVKNVFASEFAQAALPFVQELTDWISSNRVELGIQFGEAIQGMARALKEVDWNSIGTTVMTIARDVFDFLEGIDQLYRNITGKRMGTRVDIENAPTTAAEARMDPLMLKYWRWKQNPGALGGPAGPSPSEMIRVRQLEDRYGPVEQQMARALYPNAAPEFDSSALVQELLQRDRDLINRSTNEPMKLQVEVTTPAGTAAKVKSASDNLETNVGYRSVGTR